MSLATHEFIRRFLIHVLPQASTASATMACLPAASAPQYRPRPGIAHLAVLPVDAIKAANTTADEAQTPAHRCPCCGSRMIIIEPSHGLGPRAITQARQRG